MKLPVIIGVVVLVALLGGFGYIAVSDVPVKQTEITKTIPNERFFNEQ